MKIVKYPTNKKYIFISVAIILVLLCVAAAVYFSQKNRSEQADTADLSAPSEQESQTGKDIKQSTIDQFTDDSTSQTGSDPAPAPSPVEGSDKLSVGAKITAANYSNGVLNVRTLLQTVASTGTCELNMSGPGGKTYSDSADVQALPSSSTCKGFDIPITKLAPGEWGITVTFSNDQLTAVAHQEVTLP